MALPSKFQVRDKLSLVKWLASRVFLLFTGVSLIALHASKIKWTRPKTGVKFYRFVSSPRQFVYLPCE